MEADQLSRKLAVILHADVVDSTGLVRQDETLAHERIQETFQRFSETIESHNGTAHEIRGDALVAEFARASDAVSAAVEFQAANVNLTTPLPGDIRPVLRIGIAMGEVVVADHTVTGEGIVLAQRLEQLADPGNINLQGAAYDTIPKRLPFEYEDLGEQELKGFDDPVRVYRVGLHKVESARLSQAAGRQGKHQRKSLLKPALIAVVIAVVVGFVYMLQPGETLEEPASLERMAYPLPEKPSIAVLPFTNMSDDARQEYFVDGMTEDLITDISKIPELFVIARNSVFTYKGKSVKVREVAEELGVRYVLEGSVRRSGDQVRINAQLIDATTGGHLWAERYDGSMEDVFALTDKVTKQIVNALALNLQGKVVNPSTVDTQAYDDFLKGWAHYQRHTAEDMSQAITYFKTAIELDENYSQAHAAMAAVYWEVWENQWAQILEISRDEAMANARVHLQQAMKEPSALAHRVASSILIAEGDFKTAAKEAEQIIALDSNDSSGYAILANALALSGDLDTSKSLLAKAERLDPIGSRLHSAVLEGDTDSVGLLIADGILVDARNYQGRTALHLAAIHDQAAVANLLIEAGADIEKLTPRQSIEFRDLGSTPLILTAINGSTSVARLLIAAGANVNARELSSYVSWGGFTALHYAAEFGHRDIADLLIENGLSVDVPSRRAETPIFYAVRGRHPLMVELLIDHGADVNAVNAISETILHHAVQSRDLKVIQLLIAKGVDVNAGTTAGSYPGQTALHFAALTGQVKAAELLLINDAEIDATDQLGYTPLRRAIDNRNADVAMLLIRKGAEIKTRDRNGVSLLHVLAQSDDIEMAQLLIDAGADVNAKEKILGFTPLDYAQGGEPAMIEFLEQQGSTCTSC